MSMAARKDARLIVSPLGEFYTDLLTVDAWLNNRSRAGQANILLCAKLQDRQKLIKERLDYIANKRGITTDELWKQIVDGTIENDGIQNLSDSGNDEGEES